MYVCASGLPHFTIVLYDFGTGPTMLYIAFVFLFFFYQNYNDIFM